MSHPRLIRYGRLDFRRYIHVDGQQYYLEQAAFAHYQQALNRYIHILNDLETHSPVIEFKADYWDWTSALIRFEPYSLYLVRRIDKIALIKTNRPLPLAELENALPLLLPHFP